MQNGDFSDLFSFLPNFWTGIILQSRTLFRQLFVPQLKYKLLLEEQDKDLSCLPFCLPIFRITSCTLMWPVSWFWFWVSPWTHGFLYFSTHCSHSFDAQIFKSLVSGSLFNLAAGSFWCNSSVLCYHLFQAFLKRSLHHSYNQGSLLPCFGKQLRPQYRQ